MLLDKCRVLVTLFILIAGPAMAEGTPVGVWRTYDDKDGQASSLIQIYEIDGSFEGRVIKLLPRPGHDADARCGRCEGADKDKPITGMRILWGMQADGDEYTGGRIFDPESGNTYRCKMKVSNDKLLVRGFLGVSVFGRTQTWIREK